MKTKWLTDDYECWHFLFEIQLQLPLLIWVPLRIGSKNHTQSSGTSVISQVISALGLLQRKLYSYITLLFTVWINSINTDGIQCLLTPFLYYGLHFETCTGFNLTLSIWAQVFLPSDEFILIPFSKQSFCEFVITFTFLSKTERESLDFITTHLCLVWKSDNQNSCCNLSIVYNWNLFSIPWI